METYTLTEAKAKLSSIISRVTFAREMITIRRKGKNVAVLIPYEEYLKQWTKSCGTDGLLLAKGALADVEDLDQFVENIYSARDDSIDRNGNES